jgi:uncharacterized protein YndB with AHSA1/START domain
MKALRAGRSLVSSAQLSPARLLPSRLHHQVPCEAPPADVWAVLRDPHRWSEFETFLARVDGAAGHAVEGQRLLAVSRGFPVRIPLDVRRVVPRKALHLTIHSVPGLREELDIVLVPATRGGTQITFIVRLSGPLSGAAVLPLWFASGVTARLLARAAEREQRRRLRDTPGVA